MMRVRPLLVRIGFSRTIRSPLRAGFVSFLVGLAGSFGLACCMSVVYTGAVQEWMGSGVPERISGVPQPLTSIRVLGERMALNWRSTWCLDNITVERLPETDWKDYGDSAYPWPEALESRIQSLRAKHLSDDPSARRPELLTWSDMGIGLKTNLPYWASAPASGSNEAIVNSMGFGWPFRATLAKQVQRRDATTNLIEDAPIWETRTQEIFNALAWRPIIAGLLADGILYGVAVWLAWIACSSMIRKALVSGGRCAHCGYLVGVRVGTSVAACPECGEPPLSKTA